MRRVKADEQQAPDADIWMEPHAEGHRVVYALGVKGQPSVLHLWCYEDGTVTAALCRKESNRG